MTMRRLGPRRSSGGDKGLPILVLVFSGPNSSLSWSLSVVPSVLGSSRISLRVLYHLLRSWGGFFFMYYLSHGAMLSLEGLCDRKKKG